MNELESNVKVAAKVASLFRKENREYMYQIIRKIP